MLLGIYSRNTSLAKRLATFKAAPVVNTQDLPRGEKRVCLTFLPLNPEGARVTGNWMAEGA